MIDDDPIYIDPITKLFILGGLVIIVCCIRVGLEAFT